MKNFGLVSSVYSRVVVQTYCCGTIICCVAVLDYGRQEPLTLLGPCLS